MKKMPAFKAKGYELSEYPEVDEVDFPDVIPIAYDVCGKESGCREWANTGLPVLRPPDVPYGSALVSNPAGRCA